VQVENTNKQTQSYTKALTLQTYCKYCLIKHVFYLKRETKHFF